MMIIHMVLRDLVRNKWRSGLSIGGIALATAMLIWNFGFLDGFFDLMVRGSTEVDVGHVQVQDRDYVKQPATFDYFQWDDQLQETIAGSDEVVAVTPRVRLFGLIGHEERSHVARILGVDARSEPAVTVMADGVRQGRWLSETAPTEMPAEVVLGVGLSRTLGVAVGDELVVIAEGVDGSMGDGLLEVVGIVESGNSRIDRQVALLHLEEAQFIAAMEGAIHEAIIKVTDPTEAPRAARGIQARLDDGDYEALQARSWQEVEPGIYEMLLYGNQMNGVIFMIIFFVVALGILNALRMSARERHREFGVMLALGMPRRYLFALVTAEGAILGTLGAVAGGVLGGAVTGYHSLYGLDLSPFLEGDVTWMGVSFSERIFFVMSWSTIALPVVGLVVVASLCAMWPAISSSRIDAVDAISGRT